MRCYVHAVVVLQLMLMQPFYTAVVHAVLLHDAVAHAAKLLVFLSLHPADTVSSSSMFIVFVLQYCCSIAYNICVTDSRSCGCRC